MGEIRQAARIGRPEHVDDECDQGTQRKGNRRMTLLTLAPEMFAL